ncbi:MAG: hypothetical protein ABR520_03585, partial [Mycobacteriales bacterium]
LGLIEAPDYRAATYGVLHVLDGVDGTPLWRDERLDGLVMTQLEPAGDVTGDGRRDLLIVTRSIGDYVISGPGAAIAAPRGFPDGHLSVLDGATGRRVINRNAAFARALGDLDGDHRSEIASARFPWHPTRGYTTELEMYDGQGRLRWSTRDRPAKSAAEIVQQATVTAADITGDGVADLVSSTPIARPHAQRIAHLVVDGRTGRPAATAAGDHLFAVALDERGADSASVSVPRRGSSTVLGYNGRTGVVRWTTQLRLSTKLNYLASVEAAPLNGDRYGDVLIHYTGPDTEALAVLSGNNGRPRWLSTFSRGTTDPGR